MEEVFAPYWEWEDYIAGMYGHPKGNTAVLELLACGLLCDPGRFGASARSVVAEWPVAAAVNLTSRTTNRRAWVGQAACFHTHGVPEAVTRMAWKSISAVARDAANDVADEVIREYERCRGEVHRTMEKSRLFG